ncbi:hypothetical protein FN846DRAFT_730564 [Sphaerosporella brunnea]|uniref:Uncharacterized protein n=1 Tax=Sphaerosporella brunnea TaxID=1250544 RepID=A0A5J5EW97_9PEZI|nr:hypothetical protein FN846DRAFT_730564 [Sphaerosporella brunnea]
MCSDGQSVKHYDRGHGRALCTPGTPQGLILLFLIFSKHIEITFVIIFTVKPYSFVSSKFRLPLQFFLPFSVSFFFIRFLVLCNTGGSFIVRRFSDRTSLSCASLAFRAAS